MAGHRMRYAFRPRANAPAYVEKSMRTPDAYATSSIMLDMSVTLRATDPASSPVKYRCPGKSGSTVMGGDAAPRGTGGLRVIVAASPLVRLVGAR
jgi:hypothetical protein